MLLEVAVSDTAGAPETIGPFDAAMETVSNFSLVPSAAKGFRYPPFSGSPTFTRELVGAEKSSKLHMQKTEFRAGS